MDTSVLFLQTLFKLLVIPFAIKLYGWYYILKFFIIFVKSENKLKAGFCESSINDLVVLIFKHLVCKLLKIEFFSLGDVLPY